MSRESDHYPALMDLNRGYFNQNVDVLVSGDPDEVINTFKKENTPECVVFFPPMDRMIAISPVHSNEYLHPKPPSTT